MPDEYEGMEELDGAGVDTAVAEPEVPETPAEPETPETPEPEPEKTPEQIEEHKRLTGSARAKAKAERLAEDLRKANDRIAALEANSNLKPADALKATPGEDFDESAFYAANPDATFTDLTRAMARHEAQKIIQEERAKERQTKVIQSWNEKQAQARKEIPDYDEVIADLIPPTPVVLAVMNASPHTAKIVYYLAGHPEEAKEIYAMSPEYGALAIGEIAATFKAPKPEKQATKAPPPLVPVKAAAIAVKADRHSGLEEF